MLIKESTDGRYFPYNSSPSEIISTQFAIKKDAKSILLADILAKHSLILFREIYGYRVSDLDEEMIIHFKNLSDLEKFINRFLCPIGVI